MLKKLTLTEEKNAQDVVGWVGVLKWRVEVEVGGEVGDGNEDEIDMGIGAGVVSGFRVGVFIGASW
jgi:hypothetical protein